MSTNGADALARTLAENGVEVCFANPGTTEMHLLAAFGREARIASHLCLFEGVATGAADGYARMARRPAATLLHLGPGLANGLANLHNARKAGTPVLNVVGEHALAHIAHDAPLTADIEGLARPVSDLVATPRTADDVAGAAREMLAAIRAGDARVCTLVLPNDVAWTETNSAALPPVEAEPKPQPSASEIAAAAQALSEDGAMLLIGAAHVTRRAAQLAQAIGHATGAAVLSESTAARIERGGGAPNLRRIPFHVDLALEALKSFRSAVLAGARAPVAFFAYPGRPSRLLPEDCRVTTLSQPQADLERALEALAAHLGAKPAPWTPAPLPAIPSDGPITPESLAAVVANALPENAIVTDEAITSGLALYPTCGDATVAHDWISNRGGSIGYSMPVAIGCAVACPDRRVIDIVGDGSACYTPQSLWTMARSKLDITVIVMANRRYNILANEMSKIGAGDPSDATMPLMSLEEPAIDWVKQAESYGVPAERAEDAVSLDRALRAALASKGPRLIEALI